MTYQQKHDELLKEVSDAWNKLLEVDKELVAINGFGDIDALPNYNRAYKDWQYAANNYHEFISWIRGRNFNPNDEL